MASHHHIEHSTETLDHFLGKKAAYHAACQYACSRTDVCSLDMSNIKSFPRILYYPVDTLHIEYSAHTYALNRKTSVCVCAVHIICIANMCMA